MDLTQNPDSPSQRRHEVWSRFEAGEWDCQETEFQTLFAPELLTEGKAALTACRQALAQNQPALAYRYLLRAAAECDEFADLAKASKFLKKITAPLAGSPELPPVLRAAVLGNMTTVYLASILPAVAVARGLLLDLLDAEYNTIEQEVFDPASRFHRFAPDLIFLLPVEQHVTLNSAEDVEAEVGRWSQIWKRLDGKNTVHLLYEEGAHEENLFLSRTHSASRRYLLAQLNHSLITTAPPNVSFVDYEGLVAFYGRAQWSSRKLWHMAKQPVAQNYLPRLARHLVAAAGIDYGKSKRVIAVDLDNTLWGGVLGEEGLHGVKAGQGDAESEAFLDFQRYVKSLADQGCVVVAVSKNDEPLVRECFEARKNDFEIHWEDFSGFRINWTDKAENLRSLSAELALPLDHFVFIDDNPTERQRVRQALPEVSVPELPLEPGDYRRVIESKLYFGRKSLTAEDRQRGESYRLNQKRETLKSSAGSIDDFLKSLDMTLECRRLDDSVVERAAQLVSKTNQFNLTTIRYSQTQLETLAKDPNWFGVIYRLIDRFGDYGWIGMVLLRRSEDFLDIDSWLMSCRVLGKTVERSMLDDALHYAQTLGLRGLRGTYLPTKKNSMVADLYPRMGFQLISQTEERSEYFYAITDDHTVNPFIRRKDESAP